MLTRSGSFDVSKMFRSIWGGMRAVRVLTFLSVICAVHAPAWAQAPRTADVPTSLGPAIPGEFV